MLQLRDLPRLLTLPTWGQHLFNQSLIFPKQAPSSCTSNPCEATYQVEGRKRKTRKGGDLVLLNGEIGRMYLYIGSPNLICELNIEYISVNM
jgi:hypothetical protein